MKVQPAAARQCRNPSCRGLVSNGRCSVCGPIRQRDDRRLSAAKRGYGHWWSNEQGTGMRDRFLAVNPLCVECLKEGRTEAATVADHVRAHRGDGRLLRDWSNLQALCERHHNEKTARGQ